MAIGVDATIENPEIRLYYTNQEQREKAREEREECEDKRRESSWVSSAIIALAGMWMIGKYHDTYSEMVDKRNELNNKIYDCALAEHTHWMEHIYPHTVKAFDEAYALPDIVVDYADPLAAFDSVMPYDSALSFVDRLDEGCNDCADNCDTALLAEHRLAQVGAMTNYVRYQEKREAARRDLKLQAMASIDRAGKNLGAPGRQAMGVALNVTNTLVQMSASGLNSGLSMFGRGLTGVSNSFGGSG